MPPAPGHQSGEVKPGVIPLRALGVGDILSGAIATMRRHPGLMLGVAAVVVTVTQLIVLAATYPLLDDVNQAVLQFDADTPASETWSLVGKSLAVTGIGLLLVIIARVFLSGFLTLVVGTAVVGHRTSFGDVWNRVRPRLLPLLGLTLVYPAVAIVAGLVVFATALVVPPLAVILILAGIVVGIWLVVLFSLATPALVLENAGIRTAFGRSRQLVRGAWWRVFGITLLAWLIAIAISLVISLPFELGGGGAPTGAPGEPVMPSGSYLVLSTIGAVIASTITEPFVAAITVLLYTDQRIRREGMHTELAAAAGVEPPPR